MSASTFLPAIEVRGVHKTFRVKGGMLGKDRHVVACDDVSSGRPFSIFSRIFGSSSASGLRSRACAHWNFASRVRPIRQ